MDETLNQALPTIRYIKTPAGVMAPSNDVLTPMGWIHLQNTRTIESALLKLGFCQKSLISHGRTITIIIKGLYIVMILGIINRQ